MKYFLLSVSKSEAAKTIINIGDYIQALASSQYYPKIDGFLDRDKDLNTYMGEKAKIIMNGWYMHNPQNWPPSSDIIPLFVAFHINTSVQKELTSSQSIKYLKAYEPIGCRDMNTMKILKKCGVDAYFSGCMTLTLGKKYKSEKKNDKVYIVDPAVNVEETCLNFLLAAIYAVFHFSVIIKLFKKRFLFGHMKMKRLLYIVNFYKLYSKVFAKYILLNATYFTQQSSYYKDAFKDDFSRLNEAERLVKEYSKASFVITSRIHCALPCLGLGTPVFYTEKDNDADISQCRLGGLKELFNVITCKKSRLECSFDVKNPITRENCPQNKNDWRNLFEILDAKCTNFMNPQI